MLIKRLTSAISKDNIRRQVARKRVFEMAMPAGGTDAIEHRFENSEYVRKVMLAFKEGDIDTLYAMRGLLLLALQFRNGTFRNLTVSARTHTHTPHHTTHTHTPNFTEFVSNFLSVCSGQATQTIRWLPRT